MLVASTGRGLLRRNASAGDQVRATHVYVMLCCLPAGVGDEVDEVVSGHGRAGHGAFAVFFEVLDDESLLEKSEGDDRG